MAKSRMERVWAWLHETFPERQIYVRSDGRVQFFTFSPSLQATLAGLALIFLGWVAFATVNVVFKDRIITAKDHRYQQMQSAYANRVADLQISYDELNGALVSAEDKFHATAGALQAKQNSIMNFLAHKNQVEQSLAGLGGASPIAGASENNNNTASDNLDMGAPQDSDEDGGTSTLAVMPTEGMPTGSAPHPAAPQAQSSVKHASGHAKASWLQAVMRHFASLLPSAPTMAPPPITASLAQHPALRALNDETARVANIAGNETELMSETETQLHGEVAKLQDVMRHAGIDPMQFARKIAKSEGVGGPEIPLDAVQVIGYTPGDFETAYLQSEAVLDQMNGLLSAVRHIPLSLPVGGARFERSSGFGARIDPFNGRYAFHPGVDFAGPWGAAVVATAPGTVVFAGQRGSYGNMVEIDHGLGIRTRYGHLSSINVRVGAKVAKGAPIGKVGSTGRSTGPHVHYEVWYENIVRNPAKFIEAGRHVL